MVPDYEAMIKKFEEMMTVTHPIFESTQFHFNKSDQTLEYYGLPSFADRSAVTNDAVERMRQVVTGSSLHSTMSAELAYDRPFRIDELLEDEFEIANIEM